METTRIICEICSKLTIETPEQCLYCWLWTDFTHCSSFSIVDFEQANAGWVWLLSFSSFFISVFILIILGHVFFIVQNCSFFMVIIFCSSFTPVWTFNTRCGYNFITKEANIPVNLIPFFNDVSFLFCRFLKSEVTNELRSLSLWTSKKVGYLFQTGQNFAAHKTLIWSTYVWRTTTATIFFFKKSNVWAT